MSSKLKALIDDGGGDPMVAGNGFLVPLLTDDRTGVSGDRVGVTLHGLGVFGIRTSRQTASTRKRLRSQAMKKLDSVPVTVSPGGYVSYNGTRLGMIIGWDNMRPNRAEGYEKREIVDVVSGETEERLWPIGFEPNTPVSPNRENGRLADNANGRHWAHAIADAAKQGDLDTARFYLEYVGFIWSKHLDVDAEEFAYEAKTETGQVYVDYLDEVFEQSAGAEAVEDQEFDEDPAEDEAFDEEVVDDLLEA